MALKITKSDDVIEVRNLVFTIYSNPGLGKTSLAFTASKPLLLAFDQGVYRAAERGDAVTVEAWSDIAEMTAEDVAGYDTIVVDTVGKALDALAADIIAKAPKYGYAGALSQQGWGQLKVKFRDFLKMLMSYGKDVVLVSHMDEKSNGDVTKERLSIQGGSKDLVLTDSDVIARISIENRQRLLMFSPTEASFGKDPAQIGSVVIPEATKPEFKTFLAETMGQVKAGLNAMSAEQVERLQKRDWLDEHLANASEPDDFNEMIGVAKELDRGDIERPYARALSKQAEVAGLSFDTDQKQYVWPDAPLDNNAPTRGPTVPLPEGLEPATGAFADG